MSSFKFVLLKGFDGTVIPNPYDPEYMATDSLGVENVPPGIIGRRTVASLLPGETTKHYNTIDCHKRALKCTVGSNENICSACRTVGGGDCIRASNELKLARGWDLDDETVGVCAPNVQHLDIANPFTTVEEAYLLKLDNGEVVMTRRKGCIDKDIVDKSPLVLSDPYTDEGAFGCTEVTMCGSGGVPMHPTTHEPIYSSDDIDFDIVELARTMECSCDRGFKMERDTVTGIPSCRPLSLGIEGPEEMGCPVKFTTDGVTWNCLSDPALQTRVRDVVDTDPIVTAGGSDYLNEYVFSVKKLDEIMREANQTDACIPQAGVDPRMAAMSYSYAAHLFGTAPELTAFNGGHLATGGLLRRSAMTEQGKWHSRIEDAEPGKIVMSESLGGVIPYIGTGAIAAHVWNGDALNKNELVGPSGSGDDVEHPNASMRVVPLPKSNIPGLGVDSVDHAVGFLASQGRVYPGGVYERIQKKESLTAPDPRGSDINIESSYLQQPNYGDLLNTTPLAYDRKTHDSGICAMSFLVPSIEGIVTEDSESLKGLIPLMHYRPCARRMCHTPIERMFEKFVVGPVTHSGISVGLEVTPNASTTIRPLAEHLIKKFSRMYGEEASKSSLETAEAKARIVTDTLKSKGLGALSLQPVTCTPKRYSSMFSGFSENILSENSPKIIDHNKVSSSAYGYLIDEDASLIGGGFRRSAAFPKPPTCWRIVCNESCFFSGRGLNSGVEGTGMQENESDNYDHPVDFYASAVMSADSVLMSGTSSKLLRPLNVPACSIPETLWHERRNPVRGSKSDPGTQIVLEQVRNAFMYLTGGEFSARLNPDDTSETATNTYAPPKPYSLTRVTKNASDVAKVVGVSSAFNPITAPGGLALYDVIMREGPHVTFSSVNAHIPSKFHYGDELWQQGEFLGGSQRANVVPTPMPLFEAQLRMRTLSSENFLHQGVSKLADRVDWANTTHTAGHYLFGVHSPPSTREETGQAMANPSTGALTQYTTLLVPKTLGPSSHSKHTRHTLRDKIQAMTKTRDIFNGIAQEAVKEACNCTCDVYCPLTNNGGGRSSDEPIAGQPSRGNRHSQFLLASTLPRSDVHLSYALLMMQNGDKGMLDAVGSPYNKGEGVDIEAIVRRGWDVNTVTGIAGSKFDAFRRNASFSVPRSTRRPKHLAGKFTDSTWDGKGYDRKTTKMMDLFTDNSTTVPDDPNMQPVPADDNEILTLAQRMHLDDEMGARARRQTDFLENATGTAPSTFSVGMFAPHVEGSRDIVAMYGTPLFSHRASTWNANVSERATGKTTRVGNFFSQGITTAARSKGTVKQTGNFSFLGTVGPSIDIFFKSELPKVMRRVFIQPINAPNAEGFACGLTAAEAICTRGKEIWYRPTTKPAMDPRATTSMEGVRSKAVEPFDTLSVKGFKLLSSQEIQKFTHHHHYGYDGLMTVAYRDRNRLQPLPEGRRLFPFTCQTDRRPFPPKWDGAIQPLALAEMGAALQLTTTLEF